MLHKTSEYLNYNMGWAGLSELCNNRLLTLYPPTCQSYHILWIHIYELLFHTSVDMSVDTKMSRLGEIGTLAAFYLNVQVVRDLRKQGLRSLSKISNETTPQFHYCLQ